MTRQKEHSSIYRITTGFTIPGTLFAVVFFLSGVSTALADQLTLTWIDAGSQAQSLTVDTNSSAADLALAAGLLGEFGVGLGHDPLNGSGTLAQIAAALAGAAPAFAADIALALALLSPQDADAIVAAVNAVPGVDTDAVLAAVHLGDPDDKYGPQLAEDSGLSLALPVIEQVPSRN